MLHSITERSEGDIVAGILGDDQVRLADARAALAAPADHVEEELVKACMVLERHGREGEAQFAREYRLLIQKGAR